MDESKEESLTLIVVSEIEENTKKYKFLNTTTVGEVLQRWVSDVGTEDKWAFKRIDGSSIEDEKKLMDLEEAVVGSRMMTLNVKRDEYHVNINFTLFDYSNKVQHSIPVNLRQKPEEIHEKVRDVFEIPHDRYFRLRTEEYVLIYSFTFDEQSIDSTSTLYVEFGYEIELKEVWSKQVEKHFVYCTEYLSDILPCLEEGEPRLMLGSHRIDLNKNLVSCLPPYVLKKTRFRVHLEYKRSVNVYMNGKFKSWLVWSFDHVSKIITRFPRSLKLRYNGKYIDAKSTFYKLGLEDGGLITEYIDIAVVASGGHIVKLSMSTLSTVADLKEEVMKFECDSNFDLACGKRVLRPNDVLDKSISNELVTVLHTQQFVVHLADDCVRWTSNRRSLRFRQFSHELVKASGLKWRDIESACFSCDGCGRTIRRCEEEFQVIPSDCCHVRSLSLTERTYLEVKEEATQGISKTHEKLSIGGLSSIRSKTFGAPPAIQHNKCQTQVSTVDEVTDTREDGQTSTVDAEIQTEPACFAEERETKVFSNLHPPQYRFWIWNRTDYERGANFDVHLVLPDTPTVGDVRKAVAEYMRRRPHDLQLERLIGRHGGVKVFFAVDEKRGRIFFGKSREMSPTRVTHRGYEKLDNDRDPFPLPPSKSKNEIRVSNPPR